ncbi:hypothetical protein BJ166DRAFT_167687 [Pestalotiopsis sp. NC0098]|nr:hypothetical protein BJ166DRAFT_167687 [Pestalotiopsis sp. NC0098]
MHGSEGRILPCHFQNGRVNLTCSGTRLLFQTVRSWIEAQYMRPTKDLIKCIRGEACLYQARVCCVLTTAGRAESFFQLPISDHNDSCGVCSRALTPFFQGSRRHDVIFPPNCMRLRESVVSSPSWKQIFPKGNLWIPFFGKATDHDLGLGAAGTLDHEKERGTKDPRHSSDNSAAAIRMKSPHLCHGGCFGEVGPESKKLLLRIVVETVATPRRRDVR